MMVTLMYLPHGKPVPEGWSLADKLEGTHHSSFAVLIIKDEDEPRCVFCGHPDCKPHDERGHITQSICKQVSESCCHGSERGGQLE